VTNVLAVVAVEHGHPVAEVVGNETDDRAQHPDEPTAGRQGRLRRADDRRGLPPRLQWKTWAVASEEIDAYLEELEEPKRSTLQALRTSILEVVPDAEQGISYGMPAFKVQGKTVAGFAAFKGHLSYLPHSGSVLEELGDEVAGYETSKGSLKFAVDTPLPEPLVKQLVKTRLRELGLA
jgi:uncharacterized protein YdhG (YjbR/CyaY superfamily)